MKKASRILPFLLFSMTALDLAGELICLCFGYDFELNYAPVYVFLLALLSVCTVVFTVLSKTDSKVISVLLSFMPLLSLVNIAIFSFSYSDIWVYIFVVLAAVCSIILLISYISTSLAFKIVASVLSVIMFIQIGFYGLIGVFMADFGSVTVVQTVQSPGRKYRAEVVDVDQGALGGDTVVEVYENSKHFDLLLFKVSKKPQPVYWGDWGEFNDMRISWKDEHDLIINGTTYHIE